MKTRYLVIHGTADNNEQAIKLCGEALYKAGIVSENFGDLVRNEKGLSHRTSDRNPNGDSPCERRRNYRERHLFTETESSGDV